MTKSLASHRGRALEGCYCESDLTVFDTFYRDHCPRVEDIHGTTGLVWSEPIGQCSSILCVGSTHLSIPP
jgi:hypothetical protein